MGKIPSNELMESKVRDLWYLEDLKVLGFDACSSLLRVGKKTPDIYGDANDRNERIRKGSPRDDIRTQKAKYLRRKMSGCHKNTSKEAGLWEWDEKRPVDSKIWQISQGWLIHF